MNSNEDTCDNDKYLQTKLFEFIRIRSLNFKSDNRGLSESQSIYKVPKKRSGHRAVCNEENLWIWGGYNPKREDNREEESPNEFFPMNPELYKFNFATKKWMLLKTTGEGPIDTVASHATILYKCLMICWGGTGFPFGQKLDDSLYICNLKTLEWKKHKITDEAPIALYGSSMVLVDGYLYILFGTNSRIYTSNVYRVNIETLHCECLFNSGNLLEKASYFRQVQLSDEYPEDFLLGRYRQEVVIHDRKIYVFGGGKNNGDVFSLAKLPAYDIDNNTWNFIDTQPDKNTNSFPQSRKFHSCIKVDDYCYVFGGLYCNLADDLCKPVENCIWRLNMETFRWDKINVKLPVNTYFHAACGNNDGTVYIHGGIKETIQSDEEYKQERINHLYSINLKMPKLKEICWSFLIENFNHLIKLPKSKLKEVLPVDYLNRIN